MLILLAGGFTSILLCFDVFLIPFKTFSGRCFLRPIFHLFDQKSKPLRIPEKCIYALISKKCRLLQWLVKVFTRLGIFPISLPYNLELKQIFGGVCIISFTQHAYHFEDAKYFLLWNKQERRQKRQKTWAYITIFAAITAASLLGHVFIRLALLATGIFAHSSRKNCSSSFKLNGFCWCTAICKSYHWFLIGLRSGLWLGHSKTFTVG